MKRSLLLLALFMTMLPGHGTARLSTSFGENLLAKPEHFQGIRSYVSNNGRYAVEMNAGDGTWSLSENGRMVWRKRLPYDSGAAAVSDSGAVITQPLWEQVDEVHSLCSGLQFFNRNGDAVRTIHFRDGIYTLLVAMDQVAVSPDGNAVVVGDNGKTASLLTMVDAADGKKIWAAGAGYATLQALRVASRGAYTLVATCSGTDMGFILLDAGGGIIWSKTMAGNFSPAIRSYIRFDKDEKGFLIYNLARRKFEAYPIPKPAVP